MKGCRVRGDTPVASAEVAVVANNALTRILFANAVYAHAGLAVPVTGRTCWDCYVEARTVRPVEVPGALAGVVAWVLSAHAGYADTGNAIEVTFLSVVHGNVVARPIHARIDGAYIVVPAVARDRASIRLLTTPNQRNYTQRAYT